MKSFVLVCIFGGIILASIAGVTMVTLTPHPADACGTVILDSNAALAGASAALKNQGEALDRAMEALRNQGAVLDDTMDMVRQKDERIQKLLAVLGERKS